MKVRQFLDKYVWIITSISAVVAMLVTIAFLYVDGARNIDEQVADLYNKEKLVAQDITNAYDLSGVTCYINEQDNVVIFNNEDCYLKVKYSKSGEVLTKEFEDTRLGANIRVCIALVFGFAFLGFLGSIGILLLLDYIALKVEERRLCKS